MKKKDQILLEEAYQKVTEASQFPSAGNVGEQGAKEAEQYRSGVASANTEAKKNAEIAVKNFSSNLRPGSISGPQAWQGQIFNIEGDRISGTTYLYGSPKVYGSVEINKASDDEIKKFIIRGFEEALAASNVKGPDREYALKSLPISNLVNWMKSFKQQQKSSFQNDWAKHKASQASRQKSQQSGFQKFMGKLGFGR